MTASGESHSVGSPLRSPLAGRSMQGEPCDVTVQLDSLLCTDEVRRTALFHGLWNILEALTLSLGPLPPLSISLSVLILACGSRLRRQLRLARRTTYSVSTISYPLY